MKTKILVLVIVVFFNVSVSFAMYYCIPIAGVYSNADYNGERTVAMIDIHRNCYVNLHRHTASKKYIRIGQLRIGYKEVEEGVRSTRAVIRYRSGIKNKRKDHCLSLDGSGVSTGNGDHSLANDAVTLLMWLYVDASVTGTPNALRYVNNGIKYDTSSNVFQAYIGTGNVATSSKSFARDQWHHVVLTFDGSLDTLNLYVDNTGPATATSTDSIDNLGNEWFIGSNWGGSPEFWIGMIDDVVIYERALSDAEVRTLYN